MKKNKIFNSWWDWHYVPCTLAVVAGPLITTVYRLTRPADAGEGSFSLAQVVRGLLCIAMIISLYFSGRLHLLENPIIRSLMFLAIYAVMTCMLSSYPFENIIFAVKLIFTVLVFASAFHLAQNKLYGEYWLIVSAWAIMFFMAITQVIGLLMGNTVASYKSDYATAGVIDATSVTATLIVSTLPVFLRFFPDLRLSLIGIIFSLVSLFFTMRRTELIAAAIVILIILIRYLHSFQRRIYLSKVVIAILVIGVFVAIGFQTQAGSDLLTRMSDLDPREGSGSGRYVFWRISLSHILNRDISAQVLGEGMGSIRDVIYKDFGLHIGGHNDWIDLPYAFGIFGLVAIVWCYFELIRFTNYLRIVKDLAFQGVFPAIVLLILISIGQGGTFSDPSFALIYAALGIWAGRIFYMRQMHYARHASNRAL